MSVVIRIVLSCYKWRKKLEFVTYTLVHVHGISMLEMYNFNNLEIKPAAKYVIRMWKLEIRMWNKVRFLNSLSIYLLLVFLKL